MEDPWGEGFIIIGRGKTEDVGIEDELGPPTRAEGVPIYTYDARQSAAVRIQGRRRIVGLHFEDEVVVFRKFDHAGVVGKDG